MLIVSKKGAVVHGAFYSLATIESEMYAIACALASVYRCYKLFLNDSALDCAPLRDASHLVRCSAKLRCIKYNTHNDIIITLSTKAPLNDQSFLLIMRASHVIKGASSNLMCQKLRECSTNLEQAAAVANDINIEAKEAVEKETAKVREKYDDLTKAVDAYHEMLEAVDI